MMLYKCAVRFPRYLPLRLLAVRVADPDGAHRRRDHRVFGQTLVSVAQVFEIGVLQRLRSGHALGLVVLQHLHDDLRHVGRRVGNQLLDPGALLLLEVELHVAGHFLKLGKQVVPGCAQYVVDLVDLVQFIVAGEEREQG